MVLSIRKISFENDDLAGAGCLWFPNLNEADTTMVLPLISTVLNYINLSVSPALLMTLNFCPARNQQRERTLVDQSIQVIFRRSVDLPFAIHTLVALGCLRVLDKLKYVRHDPADNHASPLVPEQGQPSLFL